MMGLIRTALLMFISGLLITACADRDADLQSWMQERQMAQPKPLKPLTPSTVYVPEVYRQAQTTDPFSPMRLLQALRRDMSLLGADQLGLAQELRRRKEPLEIYPLDSFTMVGQLEQKGKMVALVSVDKVLHQVTKGQYVGQNFGKVVAISPTSMTVRELVQEGAGEWKERMVTLDLQAKEK